MTTYTPTVWHDGDAITAEKLNKIEDRIKEIHDEALNIEPIIVDQNTTTLPITGQEVIDLLEQGIIIPIYTKNAFDIDFDYIVGVTYVNLSKFTYQIYSLLHGETSIGFNDFNDNLFIYNDDEPIIR